MLKGANIVLRPVEKNDLPLLYDWLNRPESLGNYFSFELITCRDLENKFEQRP